mgnify:CR=1 FL=1
MKNSPPVEVSTFLPPHIRRALADVQNWPSFDRPGRIDKLTLDAALQYPELVRHPQDTSRIGDWARQRAGW